MPLNWSGFLTALGLVFVAELGDKTQLAVVMQMCRFRRPWAVFAGASLGLALVTGLGAVVGQVVGHLVPQQIVRAVAACTFLVMGVLIARQAWRPGSRTRSPEVCEAAGSEDSTQSESGWWWQAFGGTLGLLVVAEMGDKTQLAVLTLAGQAGSGWPVFVGGTLALMGVTALGVLGGEGLSRLMPERTLLWVSAAAFIGMALLMAAGLL